MRTYQKKKPIGVWRMVLLLLICWMAAGCEKPVSDSIFSYGPSEEQRLTVYTSLPRSLVEPLIQEFQERTDIWVTTELGTVPQLLEKMKEKPGDCDILLGGSADVMLAGDIQMVQWKPVSYQIPVLIYNPKLVRQNPPTGFFDLLDPAWQGKVAFADPGESDFARSILCVLTECIPQLTTDTLFRNLQSNLLQLQTDCQDVIHHVSDGSYCLAVVPEELALTAVDQGARLTLVYPREGAYLVSDGIGIPTDGHHRDNAECFMEFCLSQEAQTHMQKYHRRRSIQESVVGLPCPIKDYDVRNGADKQADLLACWQQLWEERP